MELAHFTLERRNGLVINWLPLSVESINQARRMNEDMDSTLAELYGARNSDLEYLRLMQLPVFLSAARGNLVGKKILDLGAGSTISTENFGFNDVTLRQYEPWLCRLLYELGHDVTGIDIGNLEKEGFKSYSNVNLLEEDSLLFLKDDSFDIAVASQLYDSPLLNFKFGARRGKELKKNLETQLDRVLKPNGVFLYGPNDPMI